MSLEVRRPAPSKENRPSPENKIAATQPNGDSLPNLPAYCVLMTTRFGRPRRRVYLDLGAARTAVARANENGLHAELVLARLTPVAADIDGEVTE
jgi:hypothetical protein